MVPLTPLSRAAGTEIVTFPPTFTADMPVCGIRSLTCHPPPVRNAITGSAMPAARRLAIGPAGTRENLGCGPGEAWPCAAEPVSPAGLTVSPGRPFNGEDRWHVDRDSHHGGGGQQDAAQALGAAGERPRAIVIPVTGLPVREHHGQQPRPAAGRVFLRLRLVLAALAPRAVIPQTIARVRRAEAVRLGLVPGLAAGTARISGITVARAGLAGVRVGTGTVPARAAGTGIPGTGVSGTGITGTGIARARAAGIRIAGVGITRVRITRAAAVRLPVTHVMETVLAGPVIPGIGKARFWITVPGNPVTRIIIPDIAVRWITVPGVAVLVLGQARGVLDQHAPRAAASPGSPVGPASPRLRPTPRAAPGRRVLPILGFDCLGVVVPDKEGHVGSLQ